MGLEVTCVPPPLLRAQIHPGGWVRETILYSNCFEVDLSGAHHNWLQGSVPPTWYTKVETPTLGAVPRIIANPPQDPGASSYRILNALSPSSTAWHPKYSMASSRVQHGIPITRLGVTTQQSQIAGVYSVAVLPLSTARLCKFPWPTIYGAASPPPRDCRPMKTSRLHSSPYY